MAEDVAPPRPVQGHLGMHDFWNVYEGVSQAHETQNFVKNLAIFAGLLVMSGAEDLPQHRLLSRK